MWRNQPDSIVKELPPEIEYHVRNRNAMCMRLTLV